MFSDIPVLAVVVGTVDRWRTRSSLCLKADGWRRLSLGTNALLMLGLERFPLTAFPRSPGKFSADLERRPISQRCDSEDIAGP